MPGHKLRSRFCPWTWGAVWAPYWTLSITTAGRQTLRVGVGQRREVALVSGGHLIEDTRAPKAYAWAAQQGGFFMYRRFYSSSSPVFWVNLRRAAPEGARRSFFTSCAWLLATFTALGAPSGSHAGPPPPGGPPPPPSPARRPRRRRR